MMSRAFDMGFTRWDNAFDPLRATPADGADRDAILASLLGEPFDMDCRCRYGIVLYFIKQRRYLEQMPVVRPPKTRQSVCLAHFIVVPVDAHSWQTAILSRYPCAATLHPPVYASLLPFNQGQWVARGANKPKRLIEQGQFLEILAFYREGQKGRDNLIPRSRSNRLPVRSSWMTSCCR